MSKQNGAAKTKQSAKTSSGDGEIVMNGAAKPGFVPPPIVQVFPDVTLGTWNDDPTERLPLVVRPKKDSSKEFLMNFCTGHKEQLRALMYTYGAVLFRGFRVVTAQDFEDVILCLEKNLGVDYFGTSPRRMVTKYTFTASELPNFFPIPQHLEMSFLPSKPQKLFFFCGQEPKEGGMTPLCHFGKVWDELPENLRQKFRAKGVTYVRNYTGPTETVLDPMQLKRWPEVYNTTDKKKVEQLSKPDNITVTWKQNDALRLTNTLPAMQEHPVTHREIWHNHLTTFHPAMPHQEYARIAGKTGWLRYWFYALVALVIYVVKRLLVTPENQALNTFYGDGSEVSAADLAIVRGLVWKHTVFNPWRNGDIIMIDNHAVSHGRLPYTDYPGKKRTVLVAWG